MEVKIAEPVHVALFGPKRRNVIVPVWLKPFVIVAVSKVDPPIVIFAEETCVVIDPAQAPPPAGGGALIPSMLIVYVVVAVLLAVSMITRL